MYLVSNFKKQSYKVNEVAGILNVSTKTIRKYDAQGILHAERTVGNHRAIMRDELLRFLKEKSMLYDDSAAERWGVIYASIRSRPEKPRRSRQTDSVSCRKCIRYTKSAHIKRGRVRGLMISEKASGTTDDG